MQDWISSSVFSYAGSLDASVLFKARLHSKAVNSFKTYKSGFNHWKNFAIDSKINIFPVNNVEFSIFMLDMVKNEFAWPSISSSLNAVNYFHNLFYIEPIQPDKYVLDYCKRFSRKVNRKKRPLLKYEFSKIMRFSCKESPTLLDLRNLCIVMFGFLAFLRFDDFSQLKLCDVDIFGSHVKITVPEGKADQTYKSQSVEIKLDVRCYDILKSYVKKCEFAKHGWHRSDIYFFPKFKKFEPVFNRKILYTECRSSFNKLCEAVGVEKKGLGIHSLRIGGCSEASRKGVPDYLLDLHGRWAFGSTSRAGYQRLTPAEKVLVSSKLMC